MNREQLEELRARAAGFKELLDADVEDGDLAIEVAKDVPALLDEIDRLHVVVRRVISITQDTDGDPLDVDEEIPVGEVLRMLYEFDHLAASVNDAWAAWPAGATTAEGSAEGGTSKGSVDSLGTECLRCRHSHNWHVNANGWCAVVEGDKPCGCYYVSPSSAEVPTEGGAHP